ncbi:Waprin-Phi1 [Platysternon megacephalum]|uniref:Waprin-Phi1 n=1 Tax=Platysternon megacephalum TaxID=55544 RepID=A0A4D9E591_9SAUR|nr:Waprin-Phi1 [Platysternon megacephalum]
MHGHHFRASACFSFTSRTRVCSKLEKPESHQRSSLARLLSDNSTSHWKPKLEVYIIKASCHWLLWEKEGVCPDTAVEAANCTEQCQADSDCEENLKCCQMGCGWSCQIPNVKPGSCPVVQGGIPLLGLCKNQCTMDSHCPGTMKCCINGCRRQACLLALPITRQRGSGALKCLSLCTRLPVPQHGAVLLSSSLPRALTDQHIQTPGSP